MSGGKFGNPKFDINEDFHEPVFKNCHNCRYEPLPSSKEHCLLYDAGAAASQVKGHGLLGTCTHWKPKYP